MVLFSPAFIMGYGKELSILTKNLQYFAHFITNEILFSTNNVIFFYFYARIEEVIMINLKTKNHDEIE